MTSTNITWQEMAKADRKVTAIKMYRDKAGCSLKEACDHVSDYLNKPKKAEGGMKASEFITALQSKIDEFGDCEIAVMEISTIGFDINPTKVVDFVALDSNGLVVGMPDAGEAAYLEILTEFEC